MLKYEYVARQWNWMITNLNNWKQQGHPERGGEEGAESKAIITLLSVKNVIKSASLTQFYLFIINLTLQK